MTSRHRDHNRSALVSGSGPGGAAAALALAATGFDVTVVERQAVPTAVGGALLLQPNGLAVLAGLGMAPEGRPAALAIRDRRGRVLLPTPSVGNQVVRRSGLYGQLQDRLATHPRIDLRLGHTARSLGDNGVVVETPSGVSETLVADLVVAADGIRSALRPAIAPDTEVVEGPVYVRALVPGSVAGDEGEWWTGLGLFGAATVDDDTVYVFASAAHPDLDPDDPAAFAERWGRELPAAGELLSRATGLLVNRADEVRAPRFATDRAALLGDAAHAMLPNTGQGANSALVDAAVLAIELDRTDSVAAGLAAYDRRRRPAVKVAQADARRLAALAHLDAGPVQAVRNLALRAVSHLPSGRRDRRLYQEDPAELHDHLAELVPTP